MLCGFAHMEKFPFMDELEWSGMECVRVCTFANIIECDM